MVLRGRRSGLRYAFEVYGAVPRSLGAALSYCGSRAPQMAAQEGALSRFFSFPGHFQPRNSLELPTPVGFFRLPVWQAAFGRRITRSPSLEISHARHSLIEFLGIQLGAIFPTFLAVLVLSFAVALYFTIKDQGSRWKFCLFFSFPILVFLPCTASARR